MQAHGYYQENVVNRQMPIKNDYDSQALPSLDEWESARNPNSQYQQHNTPNQYQNQIGGEGVTTPQYSSSFQPQFPKNQSTPNGFNQNNNPNDFLSLENEVFNPQYRGTNNNRQSQQDPYQGNQQQYSQSGNQQRSQANMTPMYNNDEYFDSNNRQNNGQKKSTLVIQSSQGNLNQNQQQNLSMRQQQQGMQAPNQESNYGNPLGMQPSGVYKSQSQYPKTENQQIQQSQNQIRNSNQIQNSQLQTQQYPSSTGQQQQNQQQQQQHYDKNQMNTTVMDNYNDNSPQNMTHTQYNMINNTYADQPLVTPQKGRSQDFVDLMNKTDLNITNNNIYQNNNANNNQNISNSAHLNSQQQQQQNDPTKGNYNIYNGKENQMGPLEEGIKERTSTTQQWRETTQLDGAYSHTKSTTNVHQRGGNYQGIYTYQMDNKNSSQIKPTSAHLAYEPNKNKQLFEYEGKIVNVDDPKFHDNYDLQQYNFNHEVQKLTPLEITYLKKAQKILKTEFFYDKLPINYKSHVVPEYKRPLLKNFFFEYFFPMIFVFFLHVFLWGVQIGINDYCFSSSTTCACKDFSINLWTFFRQLIAWKLGVICYKNLLMIEISQEKHPLMESFLMYFVAILIDFIMVAVIGLNDDWEFYLMIFSVGYVLTIHTIKFKQFTKVRTRGRGLYLYDLNLVGIILFIYYALPAIYRSLIKNNGFSTGRSTFLYLYPLLEWVFELLTNYVLERAKLATFFQYQMYMLILGMKVGIMTSVSSSDFEFWYLGALFLLKRIFESTNIIYVNVRKLVYRLFPLHLRYLISMDELPDYRRGREGFLLENLVWLGMYYWWFYTNSIVPGFVKSYVVVNDCAFKAGNIFTTITWDRAFFCWIFLFVATVISLILNSNLRIDMVKWIGAPKHNFIENIFTRMFGWYLFQVALIVSYSISQETAQTYSNF